MNSDLLVRLALVFEIIAYVLKGNSSYSELFAIIALVFMSMSLALQLKGK